MFYFIVSLLLACGVYLSVSKKTGPIVAKLMDSEEFQSESGLLPVFEKAKKQDGTTKVILGDSIANQIFRGFEEENPDYTIIGTNAAFMVTGQYALLTDYLNHHDMVTDVYLVMHPLPLTRTFDTEWSYRYSVMVLSEMGLYDCFSESSKKKLEKTYGGFFLNGSVINLIEKSSVIRKLCLSYININKRPYVQSNDFEIADEYVHLMYDLCEDRGAKLHLISAPVSEFFIDQVEERKMQFDETWISTVYPNYFEDIFYYPDDWSYDYSHFGEEHATKEGLAEIAKEAFKNYEIIDSFNFN